MESQHLFQYDAVIAFADLCVEAEAVGCKTEFPENNYPYIKHPVMRSIEDLNKLSVPDPHKSGRMPEIIKAVKIMKKPAETGFPLLRMRFALLQSHPALWMWKNGRFILGSGCEIPPNAKLDNIKALVSASFDISKNFKVYGKKEKGKKCISFFPSQKRVHIKEGLDLIEAAGNADIFIPHLCNKSGVCGSCIIQIKEGPSKEYSKKENILLTHDQKEKDYRLACQVRATSDMEIYIPRESRVKSEYMVYQKDLFQKPIEDKAKKYFLNPSIKAARIALEKMTEDGRTDLEIIQDAIGEEVEFYPKDLRKISKIIRSNKDIFCILDSEKKRTLGLSHSNKVYGVAVDIGTTTIAAYLYDLETGKFISSGSVLNPQYYFGDNIMTRAQRYICGEMDRAKLQNNLIEGINGLILKITREDRINYDHIYKITVVGNSVMHHMFLDLELKHLVRSPFTPVLSTPYKYYNRDKSGAQKLAMNENGIILCLPLLNGFVGSDLVVGILASELYQSEKPALYIDLGTNGEIVLGNKEKILVASVAAGPAFERFYLTAGKVAGSGVIYRLDIDENFNVHYKTLEGRKPSGLCGSAVIDTIASFLRLGLIDGKGHFIENTHCHSLSKGGYVLIPKQDTAFFQPLVITANDIEEVQKAKGGIMAGIAILMREYGIAPNELDKVMLTGAFGMNINVDNAIRIGLIPEISGDKVEFISNAAGVGAQLCLLFKEAEEELKEIIKKIEHINVADYNEFNDIFIDSMLFNLNNL